MLPGRESASPRLLRQREGAGGTARVHGALGGAVGLYVAPVVEVDRAALVGGVVGDLDGGPGHRAGRGGVFVLGALASPAQLAVRALLQGAGAGPLDRATDI